MGVEIMRRKAVSGVLATGVLGILSAAALGAPLAPGGTLNPAPGEADLAGANLLFSTGSVPFLATPPVFSGSLVSQVYNNDPTNPNGLNALTFAYRITSDASSQNAIQRMTVGGYTGFLTDASYQTPTAGLAPTFIDRPTAAFLGFSFFGPPIGQGALPAGVSTAYLVVQTNATQYTQALANVIDGGQANNIPSLGPLIPEPGSMGLALLGAGGLLARRRQLADGKK
jgi:hypothetical protein